MTFEQFDRRAQEIFASIPAQYKQQGVDGLTVVRDAVPHPSLPDVYTLGECRSEAYPSEFGGPGEVHSIVFLFYGSFVALARLDEEWDWEGELFETITHEVRHHLESLAAEDALEVQDWVEDQNFARREGRPFDPFFYRSGTPVDTNTYEVDGDVFIEGDVKSGDLAGDLVVPITWQGMQLRVPLPPQLGDIHYLTIRGIELRRGDLVLVLLRRRGGWEALRALFASDAPDVRHSEARAEDTS
jgi:hypothetical protein